MDALMPEALSYTQSGTSGGCPLTNAKDRQPRTATRTPEKGCSRASSPDSLRCTHFTENTHPAPGPCYLRATYPYRDPNFHRITFLSTGVQHVSCAGHGCRFPAMLMTSTGRASIMSFSIFQRAPESASLQRVVWDGDLPAEATHLPLTAAILAQRNGVVRPRGLS